MRMLGTRRAQREAAAEQSDDKENVRQLELKVRCKHPSCEGVGQLPTTPPLLKRLPPLPPSLHRPSTLAAACVHPTHISKPAFEQVHEVSGALATANSRRLRTLEPGAARDRAKADVAADIDNLTYVSLADKVRQPPRVHERGTRMSTPLCSRGAQAQCVHDYVKRQCRQLELGDWQ